MKAPKGSNLFTWVTTAKGVEKECRKCGKLRELSVDHIIPVSFLEDIGVDSGIYDDEDNFEYLCILCNRYKASRFDMAHPKTVGLLKKYVNSLE